MNACRVCVAIGLVLSLPATHGFAQAPDAKAASAPPLSPSPIALCFKTDRPKEINGRLDDWDVRQWDPTRLIELRDKRLAVVNRGPWGGEKDLSATIYTAWDDYNLYLAGSVRDDQLVRVPDRDWWTQDAIELFFATGGAEERRRPDDAPYSDRDYQIFLMPMNPRLPWGVFKHGSSIVLGPGEFEGVRVAFTTTSEGYDFEMVLPFVNFVGLEPKSGLSIGFDVALDDVDDATKTDTKSYMTWSGHTDLARLPSRFGRLEFRDLLPPTPSPSSGIWEGERLILWAVTLIAGLAIFTFVLNAFAVRWYSKTLTWKLTVASILVVALALTTLVPTLVASNQEETERVRLTERVDRTRRVLDEVASKQLLDLSESTGQDQLLRLLRGERVPHREAFAYECLRLADVGTQKTAEVTPYLDYGDGFDFRAGSFVFPAPKAVRADRVHFIFSVPGTSAASDPSRASDSTVGRFTIVFENGERRPVELKLGYTADYSVQGIPYDHAKSMAPNLRIASRIGLPGSLLQQHTDELIVDVPTNLRSVAIDSIELAVESPQETVRLLGITREVGAALMTFPIAHRSLVGVPVEMVRQGFDGFAAQIENDKPFVKPEVNAHADVLWIVYATLKAHPTPSASPTGAPVAEVHVRYEGGSEQTTMLLSGVDVDDAEKGWPQGHPGIMNSRVAFRFPLTPNGENVAHVDILRLPVDGKHEIQSISIEKKRSEQLRLYAMTLGTLVQPAYPDLKEVVIDAQGLLVLANESRADLASLRFSVHPRPSSASPGETEATPPIRRERLTNGDFLMASLVAPEPTGLGRIDVASPFEPSPIPLLIRTWGSYLLLGFLVPLAVVILLDLFDLGPRLRWKFAAAFAIVCIVPLGMLFPLFNNLIRANVEARLSDKAVSRLKTVLDGIRDRRDRVQLATDAMWRDNQLQDLLRIADGADVRVDAIRARLTELRNDRFPEHKNAFVLVNVNRAKPDGGFATTPVSSELGGDAVASSSMLGVANAVDENDVYSASGDLVVFGARLERPRGRGHDLLVGEPLDAAFLALLAKEEKGGRGAEILVYTTKGYPYLATLDDSEEKSPRAIAATRETLRTLEERGGTHELNRRIRNEDYHVGYCLLQNQKGATLGLIGVAVPAEEAAGFLDRVTKYFLLLGALIAGLSIFVGTLLTRKITGPIERLGLLTKEVSRGNLEVRADVTARDEVGSLSLAFNQMTDELRERMRDLQVLTTGIQSLSSELEPAKIVEVACRAFQKLARPSTVAVVLQSRGGADFQLLGGCARSSAPPADGAVDPGRKLSPSVYPAKSRVLETVLKTGEPFLESPLTDGSLGPDEREALAAAAGDALLALPLKLSGETRGCVILVYAHGESPPAATDREVLLTLAQQVAVALENARLYRLAIEDPLTGTHVHSYFQGRVQEEVDRGSRSNRPLSLIKCEVDGFARLRERYGADVAAHILREIARRLQSSLRRMCVLARSGEDRFEILLPETDKTEAREIAEGLAAEVAANPMAMGSRELRLTLSVGLASFPEDANSFEFLMREADIALQTARDRGRNRVVDVKAERAHSEIALGDAGPAVFRSVRMLEIVETVKRIASSDVTVLIQGETGVGKEVIAEMLHRKGDRPGGPLVKVNCSAIPETLLEAELFGHEKGAFTGATARKLGRFEIADKGTIFLDEIGDLGLPVQVKMLRVLQDRTFERLGGNEPIKVDVRIIAATNRDLQRLIVEGRFREDLYYRINVISIQVPPLRERKEEIPLLVDLFMREFSRRTGRQFTRITPAAMDLLFRHDWPGNVRELRNCLERAMVMAQGDVIRALNVQFDAKAPTASSAGARDAKRDAAEAWSTSSGPSRFERIAHDRPTSTDASDPTAGRPISLDDRDLELNERQRQLVNYLREKGSITNPEYFEMVRVSQRTGLRDLTDLIERRIIVRHGKTRGCVYKLRSS